MLIDQSDCRFMWRSPCDSLSTSTVNHSLPSQWYAHNDTLSVLHWLPQIALLQSNNFGLLTVCQPARWALELITLLVPAINIPLNKRVCPPPQPERTMPPQDHCVYRYLWSLSLSYRPSANWSIILLNRSQSRFDPVDSAHQNLSEFQTGRRIEKHHKISARNLWGVPGIHCVNHSHSANQPDASSVLINYCSKQTLILGNSLKHFNWPNERHLFRRFIVFKLWSSKWFKAWKSPSSSLPTWEFQKLSG